MRNLKPDLTGAKITTWTQAEFCSCTRNSSSGRKSSDFLTRQESSATSLRTKWALTRVWRTLWSLHVIIALQALELRMTGLHQRRTLYRFNPQNRKPLSLAGFVWATPIWKDAVKIPSFKRLAQVVWKMITLKQDYYTLNSLTLFWLAESVQSIFEISARDVITADYTIIMSRSRVIILRPPVIMSCMTAVHDFQG